MKRILSVLTALALALIACVAAFAADENVIALEPESLIGRTDYFATAEQLTFEDGSVTADNVEIFAFKLPKNVVLGETVTVHIKGSSDGDFRIEKNTHKHGEKDEVPFHVPAFPVYVRADFDTCDIQKGALGTDAPPRTVRKLRKD